MSTRTYTLDFSGAGMLPLPQGRFFMVKSASAALDIVARRRDAQPVEFVNVGAGLQYNALESQRWVTLEVTSASAQVVEIVISDESSVTFSQTVSVAGIAQTREQPTSALNSGGGTVLVGASADLPANASRRRITICNKFDNTTPMYVRSTAGTGTEGIEVQPGMAVTLQTTAAIRIQNNSADNIGYTYLEET